MSSKTTVRVRDIMSHNFVMMPGMATVQQGIRALRAESADTIIIERRHEDDEYGIVVLADIAKKVLATDRAPERINLYEIMTKPVLGVDPDMDIRYCARFFYRFGLSTAPVVEKKEVLGIVTYNALVLRGLCREV